jgi:hypothetical protein
MSLYIQLMRHKEHLLHRECGDVYLENTWFSQILRGEGEKDETKKTWIKEDMVETRVHNYLNVDIVSLTIRYDIC